MPLKRTWLYSLRSQIFVFMSVLLVLLFIVSLALEQFGLPIIGFTGDIQNRKTDAFNKLNLIVDLKKERLEAWLQERIGDIEMQADREGIQAYTQRLSLALEKYESKKISPEKIIAIARADRGYADVTHKLQSILNAYQHAGFYKNAIIIDNKTGKIIASVADEYLAKEVLNQDYFKIPFTTGKIFIGIGKDPKSQKQELYISKRLTTGIFAFVINIDSIFKTLSITGNALGKTGDVIIINSDKMVLASLRPILVPLKDRNTGSPADHASVGQEGAMEGLDYRGVKVLAAYRYLPTIDKIGWGMIVKQDYDEVFDHEKKEIFIKFIVNGLALLVVLSASAWVAKNLSKPIEDLATVANEVENGNYSVRAKTDVPGEAGVLAERMNSMINGIATRSERLERLNSELDDRVKSRTAALDATNKELEAFSYSVAHDLRAPLRGMSGFSQILLEDHGDKLDDQGKDYLKRITAGAKKIASLIDDLLNLFGIARDEIRLERVDLSLIAKTIIEDLQKQEPDRDIQCVIKATQMVNCDARLLRVAMQNLIGNAWKFTSKASGARIEFGETQIEGKTTFYVRDNGAGFNPEHKKMLFLPFHRLHTNREFDGTGIGLAIAQRVIQRHEGKIWAESELDKGATFYFTL